MVHRVVIDGAPLRFEDVVAVAERKATVGVQPDLASRMAPSLEVIERALKERQTIYGVTTGFGALSNTPIEPEEVEELQVHLLRSHAAGVGTPIPDELVRAMLLLRARTLAQGYSGVRPLLVERYVELLEKDLLPVVPGKGSVGASGDLAPFAHLALPLIGEGLLKDEGQVAPAAEVLDRRGLKPIRLRAKEGVSLLNGTEGMLAFGVLGLHRAMRITKAADIACALSVEALLASARPFRPEVHALRPHPGQMAAARNIARLLEGSKIVASHADDFSHAVQDAYSLRCAPQVHGACREGMTFAENMFSRELGAVVDNPIVFPEQGEVVSAGNFHGQPLALALDVMTIAITGLSSISERRTDRLLDPVRSSGLPAFLSPKPGVNAGYMLTQYTAAALVAENRVLSHPASVESIPTSGSQEDHVSMGWGAGRKLWEVLENASWVVAVEILCAVQGIDYRAPLTAARGTRAAAEVVRGKVPPLEEDREVAGETETVSGMIEDGELIAAVENAVGEME